VNPEDQPLSIEDLAQTYGYPISLFRLAVDCGCPTSSGQMSYSSFVIWFLENYSTVRAKAGLPELPNEEGLTGRPAARIKICNALLTLTDYLQSRASDKEIKIAAADTSEFILGMMDEKE
jgi:hypothetical protein